MGGSRRNVTRQSELDLDGGTLQVQRIIAESSANILIHPPKTKAGQRPVPLSAFAVQAIREHRARSGVTPHPTAWVLANQKGGPLRRGNLHVEHWGPLRERAGVPWCRFHDRRHKTASLLLKRVVHPKVVQAILGHTRIGITLDVYSHLMEGVFNEAVDALDGLLGSR
jgi:integrase